MLVLDMILFGLNCRKEQNLQVPLRCFSHALGPFGFGAWQIRYHFIRDLVERKVIALEYILTERQNADIFTKPLYRSKFEPLHQMIGVITCPYETHGLCVNSFNLSWPTLFFIKVWICITFMHFILGLLLMFFSFFFFFK